MTLNSGGIEDDLYPEDECVGTDDGGDTRPIHWRAAVAAISQMTIGDTITDAQFAEWFCAPYESNAFRFQFMPMRRTLRDDHDIGLTRVRGVGYSVSTADQNVIAQGQELERAKHALRNSASYGRITRVEDLTGDFAARLDRQSTILGAILSVQGSAARKIKKMDDATREKMRALGTGKTATRRRKSKG